MPNELVTIEKGLADKALISRFSAGRFDKDMKPAAERQFAMQLIAKNEELQRCTVESLQTAMLDAAYSGLSFAPSLAHAYMIPYRREIGPGQYITEASFSPGYRGLMHLCYKAGTVKSIQSNLVHDNDAEFKVWTDENGRHILHTETRAISEKAQITHAYMIANLTAGGPPIIEVMNAYELRKVEEAAKKRGPKGGMVWRGVWRPEMCRKAVIRRGTKFLPKDDGGYLQHLQEVYDRYDGIEFSATESDAEPPDQELCLSADMIADLDGVLQDKGVPPIVTGDWLRRYAERLGYNVIENVPQRLYEQAKRELSEYARQYRSA